MKRLGYEDGEWKDVRLRPSKGFTARLDLAPLARIGYIHLESEREMGSSRTIRIVHRSGFPVSQSLG